MAIAQIAFDIPPPSMFSSCVLFLFFLFDTVYKIRFRDTRYPHQEQQYITITCAGGRSPTTENNISRSSKFSIDEEEILFLKLGAWLPDPPNPKVERNTKVVKSTP